MSEELIRLMINEAGNEYSAKIPDSDSKDCFVGLKMQELGQKPGFMMALLLLDNEPELDKMDSIVKFLSGKFSKTLFGLEANVQSGYQSISIKYNGALPSMFSYVCSPSAPMNEKQQYWFDLYTSFMVGVFSGAILHFGKKSIPKIKKVSSDGIEIDFDLEDMKGTWEIALKTHF